MLGKMRVISSLLLSATMLLLLTFRVLPHHHHALHLPGSDVVVATLHFGTDVCSESGETTHDHHQSCPSEHADCIVEECKEIDYYKYTHYFELSPAMLFARAELLPALAACVHVSPYFNLKIPDCRVGTLSLRAPPYTV